MKSVYGIWIGDDVDCQTTMLPTLHATWTPCWFNAVGRKRVPPSDPHYLAVPIGDGLGLNMIDAPTPKYFAPDLFRIALSWLDANHTAHPLVHCNQGVSRSPSIVMLWLARRAGFLPAESFDAAREAFVEKYPDYHPGVGISEFLRGAWLTL